MGFFKSIKKGIKSRYQEEKEAFKQRSAAGIEIRKEAREASLNEKKKQAVKYAKEKERFKTQQRIKNLKTSSRAGSNGFGLSS